jgi:cytochrome c-type biogenesis protein
VTGIGQFVTSGPLILALPVAAAAGAVTFLSPCCLPLVPGYLSFVTGMAGASGAQPAPADAVADGPALLSTGSGARVAVAAPPVAAPPLAAPSLGGTAPPRGSRGRVVAGTALFVLGFSVVFVAYGAALGGLGHLLTGHARLLTQVLGALTIALGLLFAGVFDRFSFAGRIVRPSARPKAGLAGAPLLGVMFGLGWTPCIGPTLTAVLALSASSGTVARGAILAFVYALGLGIPFLLVSLGFQVVMRAFAFARRRARLVTRIGGAMLVCVGLLEVTGEWSTFMAWLQVHWVSGYQPPL